MKIIKKYVWDLDKYVAIHNTKLKRQYQCKTQAWFNQMESLKKFNLKFYFLHIT